MVGLSAAFAEVYTDPLELGVVVVGTDGSDAGSDNGIGLLVAGVHFPIVAVSQGGCANGTVAIAIGESSHDCWWNGWGNEAYGYVAIGLLGAEGGIAIGGGDGGMLALGGGDASGLVAVSDTGDAGAGCLTPIPWGDNCAEPGVAVSGTGTAYGDGHTVSGTGESRTDWGSEWDTPRDNPLWPIVTISGLGNASGGNVAISGAGTAYSRSTTTSQHPVPYDGVAVSGMGSAAASGAMSVAVAGGNANSNGLLCFSATGNCYGSARVALAPLGRCCN